MRALLRSKMQSRPDARASDREFGPSISLAARPSTRGPPPLLRGLRHIVSNMSVERSVSRGEARAGAEESLKKPSGERERRARAPLSFPPFSARRHSRGVLARHRLPPVRASGRRPNRGCIPARIGRVAVKRLAPDRQSPTSSPLATLSLCVVRRARVSRGAAQLHGAAREGG